MAEIPAGKRINTFSGELEDAPALNIAPSPADQRILSMIGDKPLIELCAEVVDSLGDDSGPDVETHVGPSLTEDSHPRLAPLGYVPQTQELVGPITPDDPECTEPVEHINVLPGTAQAVADGAAIADRTDKQAAKVEKSVKKAEKELADNA